MEGLKRCGETCASYDMREDCPPEETLADGCGCPEGMILDYDVSLFLVNISLCQID